MKTGNILIDLIVRCTVDGAKFKGESNYKNFEIDMIDDICSNIECMDSSILSVAVSGSLSELDVHVTPENIECEIEAQDVSIDMLKPEKKKKAKKQKSPWHNFSHTTPPGDKLILIEARDNYILRWWQLENSRVVWYNEMDEAMETEVNGEIEYDFIKWRHI